MDPGVESPSLFWEVLLKFPHPGILSDEQMQSYFQYQDGRWSNPIKSAITGLAGNGLDLNTNWALSHQKWHCPACMRSKDQILRLSKKRILLAKLEFHHDHIRDIIWRRAREKHNRDEHKQAPSSSYEILNSVRDIISRFSEVLVCADCNSADGKVKSKHTEIDRAFTFTPSEIREFIVIQHNKNHVVNFDRALAIWMSQKEAFQFRMGLLDSLLSNLHDGLLKRDSGILAGTRAVYDRQLRPQDALNKAFDVETRGSERAPLLSELRQEFLRRSVQRDIEPERCEFQ